MRKKLNVLTLFDAVAPTTLNQDLTSELKTADWKTEAAVLAALDELGYPHEQLAIFDDLDLLRQKLQTFSPDVIFNLADQFRNNRAFDQHIVVLVRPTSVRMCAVSEASNFNVYRGPESGPHACPCCGYLTLEERGSYGICSVCFWEDDGQDDHDADVVRGGPNGSLSLTQARANFAEIGASDPGDLEHVRPRRGTPSHLHRTRPSPRRLARLR